MNSFPLISHHLFVAAVKNKGRLGRRIASRVTEAAPAAPALEIPLQIVELTWPAPMRCLWGSGDSARRGSP